MIDWGTEPYLSSTEFDSWRRSFLAQLVRQQPQLGIHAEDALADVVQLVLGQFQTSWPPCFPDMDHLHRYLVVSTKRRASRNAERARRNAGDLEGAIAARESTPTDRLLEVLIHEAEPDEAIARYFSARDIEHLRLLSEGLPTREVARRLGVSVSSEYRRRTALLDRLTGYAEDVGDA